MTAKSIGRCEKKDEQISIPDLSVLPFFKHL